MEEKVICVNKVPNGYQLIFFSGFDGREPETVSTQEEVYVKLSLYYSE